MGTRSKRYSHGSTYSRWTNSFINSFQHEQAYTQSMGRAQPGDPANGGVLSTGRVRLGMAPPDYYQPIDPIENSLLIINGGDLQGPITFYEHASVQVLTDYSQSHPWSSTPDSLFIGGNAKLTFNYDFTLSSDIAINDRLTFSSTADLMIEGDRSLAQPGIIELGGNDVRSEVGPDGRYSLTNLSLIEGYGRLNLPVENYGAIEPDLGSPGLVFNRTLNLHPTSSLRFKLGFVEGEMIASKLSSPYAIHLEGNLNVSYFGDGAPFDDQMEILLIDAGEITGTFSNLVNGRVFLWGGEGSFLVAESEPGHIVLRDFIPGSSIPDHPKPNTPLSFAKIDGLTLLIAQTEVAGTGVEYSHDMNNWMPVPEEAFHDGTETFWKVADMRGDTPIFYRANPTPVPAENQ